MAPPGPSDPSGDDVLTKVSTDAAQTFIESYYPALQSSRSNLTAFYAPPAAMPDGKPLPAIVLNGNVIPTPADLQILYEQQMPHCDYQVQSYDAHVLNKNYLPQGASAGSNRGGKNISIIILVSGYVRYGDSRDEPLRAFSETFVLIPNLEKGSGKTRTATRGKEWLIQSQTFRIVV